MIQQLSAIHEESHEDGEELAEQNLCQRLGDDEDETSTGLGSFWRRAVDPCFCGHP